jgi:DNA-binding NarL/FixJ family response regulator
VSRGESYFSEHVQERVLRQAGRGGRQNRDSVQALSDRELQIFELVGRGLGTRVIAERLEISVKTVESHLARIKEKLDLKNHTELLQRATLWVSEEDRN